MNGFARGAAPGPGYPVNVAKPAAGCTHGRYVSAAAIARPNVAYTGLQTQNKVVYSTNQPNAPTYYLNTTNIGIAMSRKLLNVLFALLVVGSTVASTCYADNTFAPADSPSVVERRGCGCEDSHPTCAPAHAETVALPPPLTVAYKDPCHPCCANCITYSNLHIDNDGDECCKPAAVIKTHHFVKEINYKCCTGPCGDVCCEPCCTKIVCNQDGNKGSLAVWPDGARYCHGCCEACCHHHDNCCHHDDCCHHEPCCHRDEYHHEECCHREPCCGHHKLYCCDHEGGYNGHHHHCCDDDYGREDGYDGRNHHHCCCEHNTCCEKCIITHAVADNCGTHYCVTSCVKDPCGNRCVQTHHCYAPNPSPCPCKENLSTECCITHFIVEPPCGCGCGCGCCCPEPLCTPSFQGSHAPELPPAPSAAPQCPAVPEKAPQCPACPDTHAYQQPQSSAPGSY
ncbi:hypothetical protein EV177_005495 [Coemansia sp. RSA 1804]|nr:hypothetical protein EV177_005495 [Coemansia sp. RSA 1804]